MKAFLIILIGVGAAIAYGGFSGKIPGWVIGVAGVGIAIASAVFAFS